MRGREEAEGTAAGRAGCARGLLRRGRGGASDALPWRRYWFLRVEVPVWVRCWRRVGLGFRTWGGLAGLVCLAGLPYTQKFFLCFIELQRNIQAF